MKKSLHLQISGIVQGVGFRPFIWRLAQKNRLTGWVRNTPSGVEIIAEGEKKILESLAEQIKTNAPNLVVIETIDSQWQAIKNFTDFIISETIYSTNSSSSLAAKSTTAIGIDTAICDDCLEELISPTNRRYRYSFITCTNCGPRYTLTHRLPYDRAQTSLANFELCSTCALEYQNPANRRFHAETTCCNKCGPKLQLLDKQQNIINGDEISETLKLILAGKIVAIKGLGGFHLVCDAKNISAVNTLRQRKSREQKPFALMCANINSAKKIALINHECEKILQSPQSPIVLVPKKNNVKFMELQMNYKCLGLCCQQHLFSGCYFTNMLSESKKYQI